MKETTLTIGGIFSLLFTVVLTTVQVLPAYAGAPPCLEDLDCPLGFVCDISNVCCDPNLGPCDVPINGCSTDDDCPPGEFCEVDNSCLPGNACIEAFCVPILNGNGPVGVEVGVDAEYITPDTTALLLAGAQANLVWILSGVLAGAGVVAFKLRKKV